MMPAAINSTNSSLPQAQEVPLVSTACPRDTNYITLNPVPSTSMKTTGKLPSQVINGDDPSCTTNINNTGGNYASSEKASMSNFHNFDDSGVYDDGSNIFSLKEQIKELRKENDELKEKIKSLESSNKLISIVFMSRYVSFWESYSLLHSDFFLATNINNLGI